MAPSPYVSNERMGPRAIAGKVQLARREAELPRRLLPGRSEHLTNYGSDQQLTDTIRSVNQIRDFLLEIQVSSLKSL